VQPFFSPDGQWIGFFADSKLKKVQVTAGAPMTLADAVAPRGGVWADDGTIFFSISVNLPAGSNPLFRVPCRRGKERATERSAPPPAARSWV
jgi:serine/threonine-protein kinase